MYNFSNYQDLKILIFNSIIFMLVNFISFDFVLKICLLIISIVLTVLKCIETFKKIQINNKLLKNNKKEMEENNE